MIIIVLKYIPMGLKRCPKCKALFIPKRPNHQGCLACWERYLDEDEIKHDLRGLVKREAEREPVAWRAYYRSVI